MLDWSYEIRDKDIEILLKDRKGFDCENDAMTQAVMDATVENIKNYYIKTVNF